MQPRDTTRNAKYITAAILQSYAACDRCEGAISITVDPLLRTPPTANRKANAKVEKIEQLMPQFLSPHISMRN